MSNRCYLDANFLVYLGDINSPFNIQSIELFQKLLKGNYKLFLSSLVIDEYIYSVIKQKDKSEVLNQAWKELKNFLLLTHVAIINPGDNPKQFIKIIKLMKKFKLRPRDAYHLLMMVENRIKYFATFDNDFKEVFESGKIKKFV